MKLEMKTEMELKMGLNMKHRAKFVFCALVTVVVSTAMGRAHVRSIDGPVMCVEDGLVLGNGDLSVSVFQTADTIVFRFGKGDVWDRRLETNGCIRPAHIREYRDGILREGWMCNPFDGKKTVAVKGTKNEARMRELCNEGQTPIKAAPYPCPKPTGDLIMHIPSDLPGVPSIRQRLFIEEGRLNIAYSWPCGISLSADAVVDCDSNVFSLSWQVDGWNDHTFLGTRRPVWFSVYRKKDSGYLEYARSRALELHNDALYSRVFARGDVVPLESPRSFIRNGSGCVEQAFYPDMLFPEGFRCRLTLHADPAKVGSISCSPALDDPDGGAYVFLLPDKGVEADGATGELAVTVTTSNDKSLDAPSPKSNAEYVSSVREKSAHYWEISGIELPQDEFMEDLWYATYHARRCILRGGTVSPGLFFPSTVGDYSLWHGDYHSNYNLEAIYWGDFTVNRLEQADAYFDACDWFSDIGREIAQRYYNARGHYIPLEGYPIKANDDYAGRLPLGRMVYMTGWMADRYWERYEYTCDRVWLKERGYPFIKDSALFYLDFLLKAPHPDLPSQLADGKYHAFPSICGEAAMGDPLRLADGAQVMMHVRHTLWYAIKAAEVLGVDEDLRKEWKERLVNLPGEWGPRSDPHLDYLYCAMDPAHTRHVAPFKPSADDDDLNPGERPAKGDCTWYEGHTTYWKIGNPRSNSFKPSKGYANMRRDLMQWTRPNGLVCAMAIARYGRAGAWTETLSVMTPFQEMMLQSWDGAVNVFPRWPKKLDASFHGWRAKGGLIVDASQKDGKVVRFEVLSEKGADCLVHGDWSVVDASGNEVATDRDEFGRMRFKTVAGGRYRLIDK